MAITGLTGAAGMAVESQFCTVPLNGSASPYTIGGSANPLRYFALLPGSGMTGSPTLQAKPEVDGGVEQRRILMLGKTYSGTLTWHADPENLHYPLMGALGRDIQTLVQSASVSQSPAVYRHVFLPGSTAPSFTIEEDMGDGLYSRLSAGAVVERLDLHFGTSVTAAMELAACRQLPNTYPNAAGSSVSTLFGSTPALLPPALGGDGVKTVSRTTAPAYVDLPGGSGALAFAGVGPGSQNGGAWLAAGGQALNAQMLPGTRIRIERAYSLPQTAGSGYDPGAAVGGRLAVSGRLVALYEDMSLPAASLAFQPVSLNFRVTGPLLGTSGQAAWMEVWVPNLCFERTPLPFAEGAMLLNADWTAQVDSSAGFSVQITLQNSFNTAALGGQGASGGPGGWRAA